MFCQKCGNKLSENDKFCIKCGTKIESQETNNQPHNQQKYETQKHQVEASKIKDKQLHNDSKPHKSELWYFLVCSAVYPYLFLMDITHYFSLKRYFEQYYGQMYGYGTYNFYHSTLTASQHYIIFLCMIPVFYETYFITQYMERFHITGIKPKAITFIIMFIGTLIALSLPCELAPFSIYAISYFMKKKTIK